jgi:outer membrane lipoprotein carrier protein
MAGSCEKWPWPKTGGFDTNTFGGYQPFRGFFLRDMPRIACIALSFMMLVWVKPAFAGDQVSSVIQCIQKRYGNLPGLTVPYEREILTRSMALLGDQVASDRATGRIYFKPPHCLRVEQQTPTQESVISNASTLWWYIPEKKKAYQYPAQKLGKELRIFADIFQGLRQAEESFIVSLGGDKQAGERQLELTPNPSWPDIDHITLHLASEDCRIEKIEIYNVLGGMTRFILGKETVEKNFQASFFTFTPPEDVEIIKED